jgi:hypothetical protein
MPSNRSRSSYEIVAAFIVGVVFAVLRLKIIQSAVNRLSRKFGGPTFGFQDVAALHIVAGLFHTRARRRPDADASISKAIAATRGRKPVGDQDAPPHLSAPQVDWDRWYRERGLEFMASDSKETLDFDADAYASASHADMNGQWPSQELGAESFTIEDLGLSDEELDMLNEQDLNEQD